MNLKTTRTFWTLIVALVGVTTLSIFVCWILYTKWAQAKYDKSVSEANARAMVDTARTYQDRHTRTVAIFAQQLAISMDSIARLDTSVQELVRKEKLAIRSLTNAEFRIAALEGVIAGTRGRDSIAAIAAFIVNDSVYTGSLSVRIPYDTLQAPTLNMNVEIRPFRVGYIVGCTPAKDVTVALTTPLYVHATVYPVSTDPVVCHGERPRFFTFDWSHAFLAGGVGVLLGALIGLLIGSI